MGERAVHERAVPEDAPGAMPEDAREQGGEAPAPPISAALARAADHAGLVEVRSASRLGFLGVWLRRFVQRLTRFQWQHQSEYNRSLIDAYREQQAALAELGNHLHRIATTLEAVVEQVLPAHGDPQGAVSRTGEQIVGEVLPAHGNQLGAVSRTVEQIVGEVLPSHGDQLGVVSKTLEELVAVGLPTMGDHLALVSRTVEELQKRHGDLYETVRAHGRHLDDLATRVADFGETLEEAGEREAAFEQRLRADTEKLAEAVADFEARLRPNLHFDSFDFARKHRGSEEELTRRFAKYAVAFGPVARVLDVGCGRGEFLQACREAGVGAYGIETDPDMVSRCRMKALEVHQADVLEHLRSLEDRSLDGIFMAQVIEHLTPSEIVDFVRLAADKMRRGGKIIIETINPDTFSALRWFWMDPTHRQPVPEAMLRFLLEDAGFTMLDVLYSSPVPEEEALQRLPENVFGSAGPGIAEAVRAYNRNVERLNRILYGEQDYAVIAER